MTLPGGRVVLGWWRALQALGPRRLWFAHLVLHRVEALVEVASLAPLSALARSLLTLLAGEANPLTPADLSATLALETGLARLLLRDLLSQGLVQLRPGEQAAEITSLGRAVLAGAEEPTAARSADIAAGQAAAARFADIAAGQAAAARFADIAAGQAAAARFARRIFYFADGRPPFFLPLASSAALPFTPVGGWRFDLSALESCLSRTPEWKEHNGFPADVLRLIRPHDASEKEFLAVSLDRPEQALLVLVETAQNRLLGLAAKPDTWSLDHDPVLRVESDVEWLPALVGEVGIESWRQAWHAWCQQRSLPSSEVDACKLELQDHRLLVRVPVRLLERLQKAKSELLRGEVWLLAGNGRIRPAAQVEIASY
jgi:hypothetical protein